MKFVGFGCALCAVLAMAPVLAGTGAPGGKAQPTRPQLTFRAIFHVVVQCGAVEKLSLFDPEGNRAYVDADTSTSGIPGCPGGVTVVQDVADTSGGMPGGWYFEAQQPQVGSWRLEVVLPPNAPAPSDVMIDAMVISRGTHKNLCDALTLEPGQMATWQLRVLPTGTFRRHEG